MRWFAVVAVILAIGLSASAQSQTTNKPGKETDQAKALDSAFFGRLVGSWDVGYDIYDKDGNVRRYKGQATYTWILNGGALQEVWTSDAHNEKPQPFSTMIDFYDTKRQSWTSVWIYPAQGTTMIVTGGEADGHLVLTGHDQAGALQRWSTNDMKPDSFEWRYEISSDEGKTWRLLGMNHMHRSHR